MAKQEAHTIDGLFSWLDDAEKIAIVSEAGLQYEWSRTGFRFTGWGPEVPQWMADKRQRIAPILLPMLLRKQGLDDEVIQRIIREGDLKASVKPLPSVSVHFALPTYPPQVRSEEIGGRNQRAVRLTDLVAGSAVMMEMFIAIGGTIAAGSSEEPLPPIVDTSSGSVSFNIGGGLFGSGIALIVACAAGLVAAPVIGPAAGTTLAVIGIIDMAIDWRKRIAETDKLREERRVLQLEHNHITIYQNRELQELEIRKRQLELEALTRENHQQQGGLRTGQPPCTLVDEDTIRREAARLGLSDAYAMHVLNKGLPTYLTLRQQFADIAVHGKKKA
jgi:hypothetical protein